MTDYIYLNPSQKKFEGLTFEQYRTPAVLVLIINILNLINLHDKQIREYYLEILQTLWQHLTLCLHFIKYLNFSENMILVES